MVREVLRGLKKEPSIGNTPFVPHGTKAKEKMQQVFTTLKNFQVLGGVDWRPLFPWFESQHLPASRAFLGKPGGVRGRCL